MDGVWQARKPTVYIAPNFNRSAAAEDDQPQEMILFEYMTIMHRKYMNKHIAS